ncbi:peroxiredoxin-like family protein [Fusobacterium sp. IOR10]|uniref:peroxiredoxin-like family protein n=1 Tax=Fusobacterium sp. IOR10 TaxID=2665157 RepID=UPI0013D7D511|nr:peroxiredoxin-like family protein [Fusobacterium sp. IOR10]
MSENEKKVITNKSLKAALKEANEMRKGQIPPEILVEMKKATEDLKAFNFKEKTLQIGDTFPEATLLNYKGEATSLKGALDGKPAIISFYRGTWCPYCNLELAYYSELLGEKENKGVRMFAISPEKPDVTIEKTDPKSLNFTICSDVDNKLAKKLNLVFGLPEKIQAIYKKFGIDVDNSQGNTKKELPIPATFIVDGDGKVTYVDLDEDYTTRPDAQEVVTEYKKLI